MENNTTENNAQNNNKTMLLVGGVVLAIIAVVVIVVLFVVGGSDESDDAAQEQAPTESAPQTFTISESEVNAVIDDVRSNYVPEWIFSSPEDATAEDGTSNYTFISGSNTLNLQVNADNTKDALFGEGTLAFTVDSFNQDRTDTADGLAALALAFGYEQADIDSVQTQVSNLVSEFGADPEQADKSGQFAVKNTNVVVQIGVPEDNSPAIGLVLVALQ